MYDITDGESLSGAQEWYNLLAQQADLNTLVLALVGNKSDDIERAEVSRKDAQLVGQNMNTQFHMEVSAKTGSNVDNMFR